MDVYQSQFGVHTESEITNILKMIDKNQSGKIDFNEFLTAMHSRKKLFLEEFLAEAFNHFDVDKDGYL
jgi:Ca2+-binding EF-hand superfamily protein